MLVNVMAIESPLSPSAELIDDGALYLDFDGTLVDLVERPEDTRAPEELHELLHRLYGLLGGRLAIVSGRDIKALRKMLPLPQIPMAGSHGVEISMQEHLVDRPSRPPAIPTIIQHLSEFAASRPNVLVEEKALGVGLHFRLAPEYEEECRSVASTLAEETGMHLQKGKMLFEIRSGDAHKGSAVRAIARRYPFAGHRPIFVGDDYTDEDGFEAANALNGFGILVGPERPTTAKFRLSNVEEVKRWLESAANWLDTK